MKQKIVWLVLGSLVTLSLILAACAPKAPTAPTAPTVPTAPTAPTTPTAPAVKEVAPGKETVKDALGRTVEKPRYGGTVTVAVPSLAAAFDRAATVTVAPCVTLLAEEAIGGNWLKGPVGTGETTFITGQPFNEAVETGLIAESWKIIDDRTIIFKIRKGIRWENKPPTNGRELTPEDFAYTLDRWYFKPGTTGSAWAPNKNKPHIILSKNYNSRTDPDYADNPLYVEEPLPTLKEREVLVRNASPNVYWTLIYAGEWLPINPIDGLKKYGDMYGKWENFASNGPYLVTDVVSGSSVTLNRNPNYWRKNPLYPTDTMPYIDRVKYLMIPDPSTRFAALRTGKIDVLFDLTRDDAQTMMKTNPELKYQSHLITSGFKLAIRVDKPELPIYDKRVRQALFMSIDREAIKRDYYGGEAEIHWFPVMPFPELSLGHVPFNELPASVQELFKYNPTKAKQLLAEAGYPKGFKTEVIAQAVDVDILSIIKEYWRAIGVDLEIQVKEYGAYRAIYGAMTHKEMFMSRQGAGNVIPMCPYEYDAHEDFSRIKGPKGEGCPEVTKFLNIGFTSQGDWPKFAAGYRELTPHALDMAWAITTPAPYVYDFWQPWLRDYHGELTIGLWNSWDWISYIWIDQDLKKSMTGRK